jgi:hypothetical protein
VKARAPRTARSRPSKESEGDDVLIGGPGVDVLDGGLGDDIVIQ